MSCFLQCQTITSISQHDFEADIDYKKGLISQLNNNRVECIKRAKLSEAAIYLERSLNKAKEIASPHLSQNISKNGVEMLSIDSKSNHCMNERCQYNEGMDTYTEPMTINHSELLSSIFNIGIIHLRINQDEAAFNYFSLAIDIVQEQQSGENCSNEENQDSLLS